MSTRKENKENRADKAGGSFRKVIKAEVGLLQIADWVTDARLIFKRHTY